MSWGKRILIFVAVFVSLVVALLAAATIIYRSERFIIKLEGKRVSELRELDEVRIFSGGSGGKVGVVESVHPGYVIVRIDSMVHVCSDKPIWRIKDADGEKFVEMDFKEEADREPPCPSTLKDGLTYQMEENK